MFILLLLGIIGFWFFECVIMRDSDSQLKAVNSSDTNLNKGINVSSKVENKNLNYNNTDNNKLHKIEACNLKISDKILLRNGEVRTITDIKKISNPGKILLCLGNEKRVVKSNTVYYLHNGIYSLESNKNVVNDKVKNKNIQKNISPSQDNNISNINDKGSSKNTNNQFDYVHKKAVRHLQHDNQLNVTCPSCQKRASSNTEVCSSCGWKLTTPYVYRKVRLAGVTYENRQSLIERMSIYDSLSIKRDLNNSYDPNAIGIYNSQNQSIGWVPKDIAASLAPIMDSGTKLKVKILKKLGGDGYNFGLEVIISNDVEKLKETPVVDVTPTLAHRTSNYKASSNDYKNEIIKMLPLKTTEQQMANFRYYFLPRVVSTKYITENMYGEPIHVINEKYDFSPEANSFLEERGYYCRIDLDVLVSFTMKPNFVEVDSHQHSLTIYSNPYDNNEIDKLIKKFVEDFLYFYIMRAQY